MPYDVRLERVDEYNTSLYSVRAALSRDLAEHTQYVSGQIEVLQAQHEKMVEFVGNLVQLLADGNKLDSHIMSCLFPMYIMKTVPRPHYEVLTPPPSIDDDEIPF